MFAPRPSVWHVSTTRTLMLMPHSSVHTHTRARTRRYVPPDEKETPTATKFTDTAHGAATLAGTHHHRSDTAPSVATVWQDAQQLVRQATAAPLVGPGPASSSGGANGSGDAKGSPISCADAAAGTDRPHSAPDALTLVRTWVCQRRPVWDTVATIDTVAANARAIAEATCVAALDIESPRLLAVLADALGALDACVEVDPEVDPGRAASIRHAGQQARRWMLQELSSSGVHSHDVVAWASHLHEEAHTHTRAASTMAGQDAQRHAALANTVSSTGAGTGTGTYQGTEREGVCASQEVEDCIRWVVDGVGDAQSAASAIRVHSGVSYGQQTGAGPVHLPAVPYLCMCCTGGDGGSRLTQCGIRGAGLQPALPCSDLE